MAGWCRSGPAANLGAMTPWRTTTMFFLLGLLAVNACGDDADDDVGSEPTTEPTVGASPLPDACEVVADAAAVTGLNLAEGVQTGNELRSVCAFTAVEADLQPMTVGIEGGSRYDEKHETSEAAVGSGEPVEGIGDRAAWFYADDDVPEGVGGVLVEVDDLTIDITLQNLDEPRMRAAALAVAELAVSNL